MNTRVRTSLPPLLKPLLWGVSVGVIGGTLLLLLFALLIYKLNLSPDMVAPLALIAVGLGALLGGVVTGVCAGRQGWLMGALCGTLLYAVLLIAGLAVTHGVGAGYAVLKWAVMPVCATAGGIVGVNQRHT